MRYFQVSQRHAPTNTKQTKATEIDVHVTKLPTHFQFKTRTLGVAFEQQ